MRGDENASRCRMRRRDHLLGRIRAGQDPARAPRCRLGLWGGPGRLFSWCQCRQATAVLGISMIWVCSMHMSLRSVSGFELPACKVAERGNVSPLIYVPLICAFCE